MSHSVANLYVVRFWLSGRDTGDALFHRNRASLPEPEAIEAMASRQAPFVTSTFSYGYR